MNHNRLKSEPTGAAILQAQIRDDPAQSPSTTPLDPFSLGPGFDQIVIEVNPPATPLSILEKLGPSPFERGGFPLVGFLATTYERVSRFALSDYPSKR